VPKLVADAPRVLVTGVLLFAAVGLLIAALSTGHVGLAWGSVALSAIAAAMILRRWRRSWLTRLDAPEDESVLLEDEPVQAELAGQDLESRLVASAQKVDQGSPSAEPTVQASDSRPGDSPVDDSPVGDNPPGAAVPVEEDTDAADLLVVYELTDEVLVVDEHPRYHLARCQRPDQSRAERLPVREARELGFTPCGRCRPDTTLARKHRAARASTGGG
jgi:hypothetical protein